MKKTLLLLLLVQICLLPCFGQTLYTNTFETGSRFHPGAGALGTPIIMLDDLLIPSAQVQGTDSIRVTKVKFGIRRLSGAPATDVNFYYTLVDDTATMYDNFFKIPPILLGTVTLPSNPGASVTTIVSFGDSLNALFSLKTDIDNLFPGYQMFFLGLSFSNANTLNGWRITVPGPPDSDNVDAVWLYNTDSTQPRFATFFDADPIATFYLEAFGSGFSTLPVRLATFAARRSNGVNILNWITEQELNTSHFMIERSNDTRNFVSIGQVAAIGNSNTIRNYTFTDARPARGNNYYRLRSVDKDNASKVSDTRRIRNEGIADVSIYPNPVNDKLSVAINADKATDGQLTITDVSGKIVYTRIVNLPQGNMILPVMLSNIAAGSYVIKIQLKDDVIIKKFNKQ